MRNSWSTQSGKGYVERKHKLDLVSIDLELGAERAKSAMENCTVTRFDANTLCLKFGMLEEAGGSAGQAHMNVAILPAARPDQPAPAGDS